MPALAGLAAAGRSVPLAPGFPAVTCPVQATLTTGTHACRPRHRGQRPLRPRHAAPRDVDQPRRRPPHPAALGPAQGGPAGPADRGLVSASVEARHRRPRLPARAEAQPRRQRDDVVPHESGAALRDAARDARRVSARTSSGDRSRASSRRGGSRGASSRPPRPTRPAVRRRLPAAPRLRRAAHRPRQPAGPRRLRRARRRDRRARRRLRGDRGPRRTSPCSWRANTGSARCRTPCIPIASSARPACSPSATPPRGSCSTSPASRAWTLADHQVGHVYLRDAGRSRRRCRRAVSGQGRGGPRARGRRTRRGRPRGRG